MQDSWKYDSACSHYSNVVVVVDDVDVVVMAAIVVVIFVGGDVDVCYIVDDITFQPEIE